MLIRLVACSALLLTTLSAPAAADAPPSDPARAELRSIVENVSGATGKRYAVHDDAGHVMDTVKIIQDATGGYLAVSHHLAADGHFRVNLATSTDLLNWHWVRELAGSNTGPASQPTIAQASNGGFVMAWEQEQPGGGNNHLAFRYFASRTDLLAGQVTRSFDAPRQLSSCAEGTPNIYEITLSPDIDHSTIDIGGHYWWNCDRDRQQRGQLTNFNSWSTERSAAELRQRPAVLGCRGQHRRPRPSRLPRLQLRSDRGPVHQGRLRLLAHLCVRLSDWQRRSDQYPD